MYNIISNLLVLLQVQQKIISILFLLATSKPLKYDSSQSCDKVPYHRIVIDQMPVIKEVKKFDYTQLLSEYLKNTGKVLKPVKRHTNSKNSVPENLRCPCCNAPSEYIYDNNGGRGSFQCKVCKSTFNHKSRFSKQVQFKCPHCGRALSRMKERSCFYIWKCTSLDCSFYKDNLNSLSKKEREIFKLKPENFKLHYIFREFTTDFVPLSSSPSYEVPSSSLSRIYSSSHTLRSYSYLLY